MLQEDGFFFPPVMPEALKSVWPVHIELIFVGEDDQCQFLGEKSDTFPSPLNEALLVRLSETWGHLHLLKRKKIRYLYIRGEQYESLR